MSPLLFLCIACSLWLVLLIVYASTLPLFPKEWRKRVNSNTGSLNPKVNNDALTGVVVILSAIVAFVLWLMYLAGFVV